MYMVIVETGALKRLDIESVSLERMQGLEV